MYLGLRSQSGFIAVVPTMTLPEIDTSYMLEFLVGLLNTDSPTGFAEPGIAFTEKAMAEFPELTLQRNRKGALIAKWEGVKNDAPRALTAHTDTLGGMVKEIKPNGRLMLTKIGGPLLNGVESENVNVITSGGNRIRGSYLINTASVHVYGKKSVELKREDANMEVRLDARTSSVDETKALGIQVGDYVVFDTKTELVNGFVKSRYIDDKACVANMLAAIKAMHDAGVKPAQTTYFHISNYEEVGHGAATGIPDDVHELISLDMAAVGEGQESDEFHATLCIKDSTGPYHHGLNTKLRQLADDYEIPYKTDIYPYYGSDGSAAWAAGADLAVALIGPGVDASHNYERTHTEALEATTQWILAYLLSD